MLRAITTFALLTCCAPALAVPPSNDARNSAAKLSHEDEEAWDYANKAKEALGKGLLERARFLADKAEKTRRTRETAYLRGSVELYSAMDDVKRAAELMSAYTELAKLGTREPDAIPGAEKALNLATERLSDAKLWKKEVERLDSTYKNLSFLAEQIEKWEANLDKAENRLGELKELDAKFAKKPSVEEAVEQPAGKVKSEPTFEELLAAGKWRDEYTASSGKPTRGRWVIEFGNDGSVRLSETRFTVNQFGRQESQVIRTEGNWSVETRKLTRDERRVLNVRDAVPVLNMAFHLTEDKVRDTSFVAVLDQKASTKTRLVFVTISSNGSPLSIYATTPRRPLILVAN